MRSLRQVSCVLPYQLLFLLLERRLTPFVPLPLLSVHRSVIPPFESITPFHTRAQPPRFDQTVNESLTFLLFFLLRLTPPSCSLFFSPAFPLSLLPALPVCLQLSIHYQSHREPRADAVCPTAVPHSIVCFTSPSPLTPSFLLFTSLSGLHLFSTQRG